MRYFLTHCRYIESYEDNEHFYIFTGPCIITKETYSVKVPGPALYAYHQGAHIQDAFHMIPVEDREFLMSGISPKGWKRQFGKED